MRNLQIPDDASDSENIVAALVEKILKADSSSYLYGMLKSNP